MKELYSLLMAECVNEFAGELRILSKLHHRNVVPFYGLYRALPPDSNGGGDSADRHHYNRYLLVTKFAVRDVLCVLLLLLCECSHGVLVFVTWALVQWMYTHLHTDGHGGPPRLCLGRACACGSDPQIRLRTSQDCWSTMQPAAVRRR
jgi:hypothetical protein